jgi:hypothetical protein
MKTRLISEGGNSYALDRKTGNVQKIDGQDAFATKIPIKEVGRGKFSKAMLNALQVLDKLFNKKYGEPLWPNFDKLKDGTNFNGSSRHLFDLKITDDKFAEKKPLVGDMDLATPSQHRDKLFDLLLALEGKDLGSGVRYIGNNKTKVEGTRETQINAVFEYTYDKGKKIFPQVDFEFDEFDGDAQGQWNRELGHSSAWEDIEQGIKGFARNWLWISLMEEASEVNDIVILSKTGKVRSGKTLSKAMATYSPDYGVRTRLVPVKDEQGNHLEVDGKPAFRELEPSESKYETDPAVAFQLAFLDEPKGQELQKIKSFAGLLEIIKSRLSPEKQLAVFDRFNAHCGWGPDAQQFEREDAKEDEKVKTAALRKFLDFFPAIRSQREAQLKKDKDEYYAKKFKVQKEEFTVKEDTEPTEGIDEQPLVERNMGLFEKKLRQVTQGEVMGEAKKELKEGSSLDSEGVIELTAPIYSITSFLEDNFDMKNVRDYRLTLLTPPKVMASDGKCYFKISFPKYSGQLKKWPGMIQGGVELNRKFFGMGTAKHTLYIAGITGTGSDYNGDANDKDTINDVIEKQVKMFMRAPQDNEETSDKGYYPMGEAKKDKQYILIMHRDRRDDKELRPMTMAELLKYFSYTLEKGASWDKKVDRNPKNIGSLIKNLNRAEDAATGNGYSGTSYSLKEGEAKPVTEGKDNTSKFEKIAKTVGVDPKLIKEIDIFIRKWKKVGSAEVDDVREYSDLGREKVKTIMKMLKEAVGDKRSANTGEKWEEVVRTPQKNDFKINLKFAIIGEKLVKEDGSIAYAIRLEPDNSMKIKDIVAGIEDAVIDKVMEDPDFAEIMKDVNFSIAQGESVKVNIPTRFLVGDTTKGKYKGNPAKDGAAAEGGGTPADQGAAAAKRDDADRAAAKKAKK